MNKKPTRFGKMGLGAGETGASIKHPGQTANPVAGKPIEMGMDPAVANALALTKAGGLAGVKMFTTEQAQSEGRPLVRMKRTDLIVHPFNARPISGESDLHSLVEDMALNGQRDPIHIVPYGSGWAIIEGQRRYLAAPGAGLAELECFQQPAMSDLEVYMYGVAIHETRKDTTPIDDIDSWYRLLKTEGMTRLSLIDQLKLVGRNIDEGQLSKHLSICDCHADLMAIIKAKPGRFSFKHLYFLAQMEKQCSVQFAITQADRVRHADEDKIISAKALERAFERERAQLSAAGTAPRDRAKKAQSKPIVDGAGNSIGICKISKDGQIQFKPEVEMDKDALAELHSVVAKAVSEHFRSVGAAVTP